MQRCRAALWACAVAALVAAAALVPAQQRAFVHSHGWLHPWFHVALFSVVAYLAARSARSTKVQLLLLVSVVLFGCLTEFAESYLYGGPLEFDDMASDALGAVLGSGLAATLEWRSDTESEVADPWE